jgi:ribonuclease HII
MEELIIGVDDAGRGPVLGPMCLAGVLIRKSSEKELKEIGAKDSKLLTPEHRERIVGKLKEKCLAFKTILVSPREIDTGFDKGLNLNEVEAYACAEIINELTARITSEQRKGLKIILDCPSINTSGWKKQLLEYVREKSLFEKIICEHKADFNFVVVSAASIIAKTTRDAEIEKLKENFGIDFGSGYPSDPVTIEFLKKNALNPTMKGIFRESWSTWQEAAGVKREFFRLKDETKGANNKNKQKNLAEF